MNPLLRLAGAAIVVVLAAGVIFIATRPASDVGPPATASAAPSAGASATAIPSPSLPIITMADVGKNVQEGSYRVADFVTPFTFTLPAGWIVNGFDRNLIGFESRSDGKINLAIIALDRIYHDPCKPQDGGEAAFGPGSTIDDRVDAFSSMKGFEVADVLGTIVGGAPAKGFTLSNSINVPAANCSGAMLSIGTYDKSGVRTDIQMFGGESDRFWVVDVNGTFVLIAITNTPSIVEAAQPLFDSITFEGVGSD